MNKLITKLSTGVISLSIFALTAVPALASTSVEISGNGSRSYNDVDLNYSNRTTVSQSNVANITNSVNTVQNTGGNTASNNTGGDVSIRTGNAVSDVNIRNTTGDNVAVLGGNHDRSLDVSILGNGSRSRNSVDVDYNSRLNVDQHNYARINNNVNTFQNTGLNRASGNTNDCGCYMHRNGNDHRDWTWKHYGERGDYFSNLRECMRDYNRHHGGDVSINTGDTRSSVDLHNALGSNYFLYH